MSSIADKKHNDNKQEKKRKESILDLSKYLEKQIRVKFAGGREVSGKIVCQQSKFALFYRFINVYRIFERL